MSRIEANDECAARIAWRRAFDEQLTELAMARACRYATSRARVLVRAGILDEKNAPYDLVHQAIAATLAGTAGWDPAKKRLDDHLVDVIQWQTRNTRRRHGRYAHASLDDSRDATSSDGLRLENEVSIQQAATSASSSADLRDVAGRVVDEVRVLAAGDTDVLRILDAIESGATDHGELIKASGLRPAKFRNARRRLGRVTARLPEAVRTAVRAELA